MFMSAGLHEKNSAHIIYNIGKNSKLVNPFISQNFYYFGSLTPLACIFQIYIYLCRPTNNSKLIYRICLL